MATLSDSTTTVTLPDSLSWADEFAWERVRQQVDRSITGALLVQVAATGSAGRPITLASDAMAGWLTLAQLAQIDTWARIAGKTLTLNWRGITYTVMFRHQDGAFDAVPLCDYSDPQPTDFCTVTLRLMTV